jgi:hypothetical protein
MLLYQFHVKPPILRGLPGLKVLLAGKDALGRKCLHPLFSKCPVISSGKFKKTGCCFRAAPEELFCKNFSIYPEWG